ncbi:MAG: transketolase C-terminal domain-containing protein, partial [Gammaproteobacteria bacterium]
MRDGAHHPPQPRREILLILRVIQPTDATHRRSAPRGRRAARRGNQAREQLLVRSYHPLDSQLLFREGPRIAREGTDVTVFAYGMMAYYTELAAEQVARDNGISVEVIDLRTLLPLDKTTMLNSIKKTGKALIVHEANLTSGYGAEVAAVLA